MGAVSLPPLSLPSQLLLTRRSFPPKTLFPRSNSLLSRLSSSSSQLPSGRLSCESIFPSRSSSNGREREADESRFLDEDGVVEDMDGYLNYLSLEYDSVWDTKPSWCQPWTILLTGAMVTACSWVFLHSAIVTAVIFSLICAWWYIFLYAYPKAYAAMIAERRKNVASGVEDTFGLQKSE